ncbi:MAG: hypothetical protein ACLR2O_09535 [Coprococcus sp.]
MYLQKCWNREGIPAYAGTSEGYFQTQEVGVLLDYLRVLDNRRQDIPLAAVLRSAFAEMSDEEMAEIRCMYPDKPFFESVAEYRVHGREQKIRESWKVPGTDGRITPDRTIYTDA